MRYLRFVIIPTLILACAPSVKATLVTSATAAVDLGTSPQGWSISFTSPDAGVVLGAVIFDLTTATDPTFQFDTSVGAFTEAVHVGTIPSPTLNPANPNGSTTLALSYPTTVNTFDSGEIFNYTLGLSFLGGDISGATVKFVFVDTVNGWSGTTTTAFTGPFISNLYLAQAGQFEFVPEPSAAILTMFGLAFLVAIARRRRQPQA